MTSSEWRGDGPKIVHIETRFVVTDAINFRDVVQSLTGKNSSPSSSMIGSVAPSPFLIECSDNNNSNKGGIAHHDVRFVSARPEEEVAFTDGRKNGLISPIALKNVSFKDFDRLLADLPSMEELLW